MRCTLLLPPALHQGSAACNSRLLGEGQPQRRIINQCAGSGVSDHPQRVHNAQELASPTRTIAIIQIKLYVGLGRRDHKRRGNDVVRINVRTTSQLQPLPVAGHELVFLGAGADRPPDTGNPVCTPSSASDRSQLQRSGRQWP